jgi:hypothetical protein
MVLTFKSAGALVPGTKPAEVVMEMRSIKVLRKFYYDGKLQEIGTIMKVSEIDAKGLAAMNKAEIIPESPVEKIVKKEELKKEELKTEAPKSKEPTIESKKGGK